MTNRITHNNCIQIQFNCWIQNQTWFNNASWFVWKDIPSMLNIRYAHININLLLQFVSYIWRLIYIYIQKLYIPHKFLDGFVLEANPHDCQKEGNPYHWPVLIVLIINSVIHTAENVNIKFNNIYVKSIIKWN